MMFRVVDSVSNPACRFLREIGLVFALLIAHAPFVEADVRAFEENAGRDYLVVAKITHNPQKHIRSMKPIADYLASNLAHLGVRSAKVKFAKNLEQMTDYLKHGDVDYVTETVYGAAKMMRDAGAEPILLRWKKGQRDYQSIIFSHRDSGIDKITDLRNRKIVFEDKGSTTSYFVPRYELQSQGLSLVSLASPDDSVPDGKVGFLFSGSEQNTSALVFSKLADAGAVNSHDWDKPEHMPFEQRQYFKKLFVSEPLPRSIEMVRQGLNPTLRETIKQLLLDIDQSDNPVAVNALKRYQKTKKFEALGDTEMALLDRLVKQIAQSGENQPL